jgi:hypothetical protein
MSIRVISEAFSMQPSCLRVGQEYYYLDGSRTTIKEIKPVVTHDVNGNPLDIYRAYGEDGKICADWIAAAVNVNY